jgi:hypothetical protein
MAVTKDVATSPRLFKIRLSRPANMPDLPHHFVGANGVGYQLAFDEDLIVPEIVVEVLNLAVEQRADSAKLARGELEMKNFHGVPFQNYGPV